MTLAPSADYVNEEDANGMRPAHLACIRAADQTREVRTVLTVLWLIALCSDSNLVESAQLLPVVPTNNGGRAL